MKLDNVLLFSGIVVLLLVLKKKKQTIQTSAVQRISISNTELNTKIDKIRSNLFDYIWEKNMSLGQISNPEDIDYDVQLITNV